MKLMRLRPRMAGPAQTVFMGEDVIEALSIRQPLITEIERSSGGAGRAAPGLRDRFLPGSSAFHLQLLARRRLRRRQAGRQHAER